MEDTKPINEIYQYDNITGELLGLVFADADPEESKLQHKFIPLIPAYHTNIVPPEYNENEIPVFKLGAWVLTKDYRNQYVVNDNLNVEKITDLGELPEGKYLITDEQAAGIQADPSYYEITKGKVKKLSEKKHTEKIFNQTKENKLAECLAKANDYINNEAYFRYDDNNTIEATDGNIGKLTAYAMALQSGLTESVTWTSKEDNVLTLNAEQLTMILQGLGSVQADIWNVQYIAYKNEIENAETTEELNNIEIIYNSEGINADTTDDGDTAADTVSDEVETADNSTETEQSVDENSNTVQE